MEDPDELGAELRSLTGAMTPRQRMLSKQVLVRQAAGYVSRLLPPPEKDEGHRDGIRAAENWLADPTEPAEAASLFAAASCWDGGVRYHDYGAEFLGPAWVDGERTWVRRRRSACGAPPPVSGMPRASGKSTRPGPSAGEKRRHSVNKHLSGERLSLPCWLWSRSGAHRCHE